MKKILVPTDTSEYSRRALVFALDLARNANAEIELLFVIYLPGSYGSIYYSFLTPDQIEQEAKLALEDMIQGIDISGVILTKKIIHGKPANIIIKEVEDENIDLIVMGSHGEGAIAGALLGSVSRQVLHSAKCPVLIVK